MHPAGMHIDRPGSNLGLCSSQAVLMQESGLDPVAPELLAADRAVAAAARHAIALTKALKVRRIRPVPAVTSHRTAETSG